MASVHLLAQTLQVKIVELFKGVEDCPSPNETARTQFVHLLLKSVGWFAGIGCPSTLKGHETMP